MDARIDFYVSTVMDHVMQKEKEIAGETGKIVYAWDVVKNIFIGEEHGLLTGRVFTEI